MNIAPVTLPDLGPVEAVVFDFDGTLARLEIDFDFMKQQVLNLVKKFNLNPEEWKNGYVLETIHHVQTRLLNKDKTAAREFNLRAHHLIQDMEMEAAARGGLFPSTEPSLAALVEAKIKIAVITRNFGKAVYKVFPNLNDYCSAFIPRESTQKVKPHPNHLLQALEALAVPPRLALMVGDHPIDVETGKKAGTHSVGVASGKFSRDELLSAGADLTFDHVGRFTEFLLGREIMAPHTTER